VVHFKKNYKNEGVKTATFCLCWALLVACGKADPPRVRESAKVSAPNPGQADFVGENYLLHVDPK
jgi:hypothetical protein